MCTTTCWTPSKPRPESGKRRSLRSSVPMPPSASWWDRPRSPTFRRQGWKYVILAVLGLAAAIAVVAVVYANRAAEGFPKVEQDFPLTGPQMAANALAGAKQSRRLLRKAIVAAAIAGVLAVSGSFGILAYGLTASAPALTALLTTHSASYCGTLQTNSDGVVSLLLSNGKQVRAKGGTITIVTSCGGS